jgi:hypothetical protein
VLKREGTGVLPSLIAAAQLSLKRQRPTDGPTFTCDRMARIVVYRTYSGFCAYRRMTLPGLALQSGWPYTSS